jgi:Ca-activated chloride channel family protein
MQRLWLTGQVLPAGARLFVQHVFQSEEKRPLEAIYSFPLPRDAALRRFRITGDGFEAHSELRETENAVKEYEQGIAAGSLSALARAYGDGLVSLTVGNIRPQERVTVYLELLAGVELRDDGFRFRFPFTLSPAYHSKMRAAIADGEGELELPQDEFGDLILPRFVENASSLHEVGFDLSVSHRLSLAEIGSPSHSIRIRPGEPSRVALAAEKDVPNRDLVLDVRYEENQSQVLAGPSGDGKRSFAIIVPSTIFGRQTVQPRRTVILLDRSGSMMGAPIEQARKAIEACLAALTEQDSFLLMAFDDQVEAMHPALVPATVEKRKHACAFLKQVDARGGTELSAGVSEAARALGGEGDVIIITDGQVFGTEKILAEARATGIRLFCLGIGSASQDRFLSLLARETGGISRFVTARERVDIAAIDLFASIGRPVASGLKASVAQPEPSNVVFAGHPVLLFGELGTDDCHHVELTWDGGNLTLDVPSGDEGIGEAVRLLRGSRLITDWESRYPSVEALAPLEKRRQSRVAMRLLELSKTFGLASREMSLVAVVKRVGDTAGELPETRVVPVGLPSEVSFEAYFGMFGKAPGASQPLLADLSLVTSSISLGASKLGTVMFQRASRSESERLAQRTAERRTSNDDLIDLAGMLEPDGGMPGDTPGARLGRTIAAVLAFVTEGHTLTAGPFRLHVSRLIGFLKSISAASEIQARWIETAINAASNGKAPHGRWLKLAFTSGATCEDLEAAMK